MCVIRHLANSFVCVCAHVRVKFNPYIYGALVKPEILTSCVYIYIYIYGPAFGNAESRFFLFTAHCFNTKTMQSGFCVTVVCKHFTS